MEWSIDNILTVVLLVLGAISIILAIVIQFVKARQPSSPNGKAITVEELEEIKRKFDRLLELYQGVCGMLNITCDDV